HELGHAFCETVLTKLGLQALSGPPTEVIADLGSAHVLHMSGTSWRQITNAARDGINHQIFDLNWSGDHPPGADRAYYVERLAKPDPAHRGDRGRDGHADLEAEQARVHAQVVVEQRTSWRQPCQRRKPTSAGRKSSGISRGLARRICLRCCTTCSSYRPRTGP